LPAPAVEGPTALPVAQAALEAAAAIKTTKETPLSEHAHKADATTQVTPPDAGLSDNPPLEASTTAERQTPIRRYADTPTRLLPSAYQHFILGAGTYLAAQGAATILKDPNATPSQKQEARHSVLLALDGGAFSLGAAPATNYLLSPGLAKMGARQAAEKAKVVVPHGVGLTVAGIFLKETAENVVANKRRYNELQNQITRLEDQVGRSVPDRRDAPDHANQTFSTIAQTVQQYRDQRDQLGFQISIGTVSTVLGGLSTGLGFARNPVAKGTAIALDGISIGGSAILFTRSQKTQAAIGRYAMPVIDWYLRREAGVEHWWKNDLSETTRYRMKFVPNLAGTVLEKASHAVETAGDYAWKQVSPSTQKSIQWGTRGVSRLTRDVGDYMVTGAVKTIDAIGNVYDWADQHVWRPSTQSQMAEMPSFQVSLTPADNVGRPVTGQSPGAHDTELSREKSVVSWNSDAKQIAERLRQQPIPGAAAATVMV
jgi:hypothetical protein